MYETIEQQNQLPVEEYSFLIIEEDDDSLLFELPLSPAGTIDFVNEIRRINYPSTSPPLMNFCFSKYKNKINI